MAVPKEPIGVIMGVLSKIPNYGDSIKAARLANSQDLENSKWTYLLICPLRIGGNWATYCEMWQKNFSLSWEWR
jgi:hypothetical protein